MYGQQNGIYNPNFIPYQQNMGAIPDMLNQYKGQYQPQMPTHPVQQPIQSNGGLIWVDNEEQAKNYLVAPNNVVPMFDKSSSAMYIKSSDGAGMPTFKKYKLIDVDEETPKNTPKTHECKCGEKFVTKEQFEALQGKFEELSKRFEETAVKQMTKTSKTTKKEDD